MPDDPIEVIDELAERRRPEGARVLDAVHEFLGRFVAYPSPHCRVAHSLWIAHTHAMDAWESTPRIAFLSPEPGSGKSRCLEITELLVPNPVEAVNVTPAYLFRKVADPNGLPTILYDEIDTVFGPKAKDNEEIRGLLNAGHRRHSKAGRCVVRGKEVFTEEISAYCPVALAGLGDVPDTILTRSIVIRMQRRSPSETVEPYRRRKHLSEGDDIRSRIVAWLAPLESSLAEAWPDFPDSIKDRDADVWEPLLAVADAAEDDWPDRARVAAVALVADSKESTPSLGIQLLKDLRDIFKDEERLATDTILTRLHDIDDSPWSDLRGKPLNARGLAQRLKRYDVNRKNVRVDGKVTKGYARADLWDAWERYLPSSQYDSATKATHDTGDPFEDDLPF